MRARSPSRKVSSKRRPLRAAFVVTVAITGPAACHRSTGETQSDPGTVRVSNPPGTVTQPPENPPGPAPCPPRPPDGQSACASSGQRCAYESCGVPDGITAVCTQGRWQVQWITCNPPPPPPPTQPPVG